MIEYEVRELSKVERLAREAEVEGLIGVRNHLPNIGPMFKVTIKGDGLRPNLADESLDGGNKSKG